MRKMKDSGIEWIGKIPTDWTVLRNKFLFSIQSGEAITREDLKENGIYPVYGGGEKIGYYDKYNVFENSILIGRVGARCGCITLVNTKCWATDNALMITIADNYQYISYVLESADLNRLNESNAQPLITATKILNVSVPLPPLPEQQKITTYLDKKCSEIDALVTDIQNEIETLGEYKRSVITEAVTKGLDPDVEMKDSGVEWVEEIPADWKTNRIKYLFSNGKGLPITKENLTDEGLSVISYGQIHAKFNTGVDVSSDLIRFVSYNYERLFPQCKVFQYDFVFADTSEDYDGCGNCIYKRDDSVLYAGYHTIILHSLKSNDNRFFAYLFQTDLWRKQIRCAVSGVKVFSITQKIIMNAQVIIPSPKEQQQIANYLDRKCFEIDSIIKEKQQQLETLAEYKKSLIYEYVTGKKEVLTV